MALFCEPNGFFFFFGTKTKGGFGIDTVAVNFKTKEDGWDFDTILAAFDAL